MTRIEPHIPKIVQLANRMAEDIRTKGLKPGDSYLSTQDAAQMLGVGGGVANRALQLLEKRQLVVRRQRKGAVVAHPPHVTRSILLRRVSFLVHQKYLKTEGIGTDGVLMGMQDHLPGTNVQINFMPADNEASYVDNLLSEAFASPHNEGFVLSRATVETQRTIADSGLPVVVFGVLHPSINRLPTIGPDQRGIGRLLADYLLGKGHRRLVFLVRQTVLPGDHHTIDGIQEVLNESGLGLDAFRLRCLPSDDAAIEEEVHRLLGESDVSTGFVCRTVRMADGAARAAESLSMKPQRDVGIAVCEHYLKSGQPPRYPHARVTLPAEQVGHHIGRMLAQQARGEQPDPSHEEITVAIEEP